MSAQNTLMTAVRAAEVGAFEYLPKPFDLDDVLAPVVASAREPADAEPPRPRREEPVGDDRLPLIGRSPADAGGLPHRSRGWWAPT